jgi:bacterioferritin-associated ferredoxin
MYVCLCNGVTDTEIRTAVEAGAASAEAVMLATRAGARCGSCRAEVAQIVSATLSGAPGEFVRTPCCRDEGKRHLDVYGGRPEAGDEQAPLSAA